jgi:hypothetical protein
MSWAAVVCRDDVVRANAVVMADKEKRFVIIVIVLYRWTDGRGYDNFFCISMIGYWLVNDATVLAAWCDYEWHIRSVVLRDEWERIQLLRRSPSEVQIFEESVMSTQWWELSFARTSSQNRGNFLPCGWV